MSEKVNVLDTIYTINKIKEQDKFMIENNLCGYCDFYEKKIVVLASDTTSKKRIACDRTTRIDPCVSL